MHIYIVDHEPDFLASMSLVLRRSGYDVRTFPTGTAFLSSAQSLPPGCVLIDLKLPDHDGLEVQRLLNELDTDHAVVLLTSDGDIPDAVSAMRAGAVDFLRKPYRRKELLAALTHAEATLEENMHRRAATEAVQSLSAREAEVLRALANGLSSKAVAHELGLSTRTIDMHRARILKRLGVPNIGAALILAKEAGLI